MARTSKWLFLATGMLGLTWLGREGASAQLIHPPAEPKAPPPGNNDDAIIDQVEQEYGAHFRQIFRTELHVMRIACEPTKEQYEKIATGAAVAMKAAARKYGEAMNGNGFVGGEFDPRKTIAEGIRSLVQATLPPEQASRYQKELDLRIAARKRMVVVNLVAMIDRILILQPDQREKLAKILTDNWNEQWNQPQLLMYGRQYIPQMPDAKINPILSDLQRAVWQGVTKQDVRFGHNFDRARGIKIPDEVWDDKAVPKNPMTPKTGEKP